MFDEARYKQAAAKKIKNCRPGDWQHAQRVVEWVKKLGYQNPHLHTLIKAAYIHDIGWKGIVGKDKLTKKQLLKLEPLANKNSPQFAREFLEDLDIDESEIKRILGFIRAVDQHRSETEEEAILVDADSLSKLDINHLKEKFKPASWPELIGMWRQELPRRLQTTQAKEIYEDLLDDLEASMKQELKDE